MADIKKAYLQMVIREEHRDALRFLWVEHLPNEEDPLPQIVHCRMTRVPFGSTSSPFLLAVTLRHHLKECKEQFPDTVAKLVDAFYVHDLVVGVDNAEQAKRIYAVSRSILAGAGMELRKWASKLSSLRSQFHEYNVAFETERGDPCNMKVLGMQWDRSDDSVVLSADNVATFVSTKPVTKKTMLQSLARLYDPLGFLSPFTVRAKIIFQDIETAASVGFTTADGSTQCVEQLVQRAQRPKTHLLATACLHDEVHGTRHSRAPRFR
ncbi:uncharacterized protein LOC144180025 [Haemaphysalis longicornis]